MDVGITNLGLSDEILVGALFFSKNGHELNEQIDWTLQKSEKSKYTLKLIHQPVFMINMYKAKTEGSKNTISRIRRGNCEDNGTSRSS